jgi:hypothetical protein
VRARLSEMVGRRVQQLACLPTVVPRAPARRRTQGTARAIGPPAEPPAQLPKPGHQIAEGIWAARAGHRHPCPRPPPTEHPRPGRNSFWATGRRASRGQAAVVPNLEQTLAWTVSLIESNRCSDRSQSSGDAPSPGCGRPHLAKGLCRGHYEQQRLKGSLRPLVARVVQPVSLRRRYHLAVSG